MQSRAGIQSQVQRCSWQGREKFPLQRCSCSLVSVHPQRQCSSPAHLQEHFPSSLDVPREAPRRFNIPCFFHCENLKKRYFSTLCFSVHLSPFQPPWNHAVCLPFPPSILLSLFKTLTNHSLLVTSQVSRWYFCTTLIGALEIAGREGGKVSLKTSGALFDKWQL